MSNLININNIIQNLNITNNKQGFQLSEVSTELQQAIQSNKSGMLEVLAKSDGFEFILQLGDKNFSVNLKNKLNLPLEIGQRTEIPVKINSTGKIVPDLFLLKGQTDSIKAEVVVAIKESFNHKPSMTPIKIQNFIEQNIKDFPLDTNTKQQILQIAKDLDVNLAKIGEFPQKEADLKNMQNIIKEMVSDPQKFDVLKPQLEQIINNLTGKQLGGEIANKINKLYVVKTSLGDTYFSSDAKIPLFEKVTLNITGHTSGIDQKIRIIDEVIKNILPDSRGTTNVVNIAKETVVKSFADLVKNIDNTTLMLIARKLPFQKDNLLENIYNLYKGIINKDVTQWLGRDIIQDIVADNINGQKNITELSNMLQGSQKETTSWRIVEMPFYDGFQLSAIKIAVKKDKQKQERQKDKKTTRFVVETEFSKLGKFQFDGFSKVQLRSLDLIIRTSEQISDDFCLNIINLFKKSLYDLDYSGTIKINRAENFINFNDESIINEGVYI
ncbi:MAG: hypothetical protein IKC10_00215 [Alphaproteobacteria bacterium]|nr:hypothetical protein [Alphaproteobacteria bacterium]